MELRGGQAELNSQRAKPVLGMEGSPAMPKQGDIFKPRLWVAPSSSRKVCWIKLRRCVEWPLLVLPRQVS